ncbi:uncharacterized protein LAESUDRAFT_760202 [Laetiporus sulphureus 93-53]|uniref:20S-pre-rRNA D-site endonuclease NOB1 n=1 Tax=Laetiporus sulphureus 93-53 TaxID=1314785 RepID=A0A165DUL2_9APHY|nr:uncharacterized protein LAESUDRAFT_760202 [Laetiporus sulphureus 93-53]KZT05658.1 hypothetical protein LAESUDRAFT_760202 [Laetiporus sulphureus 93-53]
MANPTAKPACKHLVLDAGPLLSLSPLRGLAETYYTVPQVLDELKDRNAREHFQQLGLSAGVRIDVRGPDAASLAYVIEFAKKTGDYSVLSHADLCVLALTYALDVHEREAAKKIAEAPKARLGLVDPATPAAPEQATQECEAEEHTTVNEDDAARKDEPAVADEEDVTEPPESEPPSSDEGDVGHPEEEDNSVGDAELDNEQKRGSPAVELHRIQEVNENAASRQTAHPPLAPSPAPNAQASQKPDPATIYDDPSDEDDGEGEWITPANAALHKSRALELLPSAADMGRKGKRGKTGKRKGKGGPKQEEGVVVGCMTADFAMQNVLLQMGLGLVGVEGKRIERVKSWVLRCHACFKICKDNSRKFCPSCGNPSLIRASVTISSPNAGPNTPAMQVHLKPNFVYRTRGTIYSIPAPKPGTAKTGPGDGLILREDQLAWQRAKKRADGKREREERRLLRAASRGARMGEGGAVLGSWMDPDWVPEIISAGAGGQGRSMRSRGMDGDMPVIGYGRKNPNEKRKRR